MSLNIRATDLNFLERQPDALSHCTQVTYNVYRKKVEAVIPTEVPIPLVCFITAAHIYKNGLAGKGME
jgi:hypothetical protein